MIVKSHVIPVTLFTIANNAMKPATLISTDAFASCRNSPRSMATPAANETITVRTKDGQNGIPHRMSCHATNAEKVAISPWAKFK